MLTYDESLATEADIKEHTINYTVSVPVYDGLIPDLQGSFTFEILPSDLAQESSFEFSSQDELQASDEPRRAPISLDPIASEYVTYFNETSELIFNFADP